MIKSHRNSNRRVKEKVNKESNKKIINNNSKTIIGKDNTIKTTTTSTTKNYNYNSNIWQRKKYDVGVWNKTQLKEVGIHT